MSRDQQRIYLTQYTPGIARVWYTTPANLAGQGTLTITPFAGGSAGSGGDGGPALGNVLFLPVALAEDAAGNVYVGDHNRGVVRKVSTNGIISTVAGTGTPGFSGDGGPATLAQLSNPADVVLGPDGSLYIVDFNNSRIRRVTPDQLTRLTVSVNI